MALDGQNETFIARIKDAVPVSDGKKKSDRLPTPFHRLNCRCTLFGLHSFPPHPRFHGYQQLPRGELGLWLGAGGRRIQQAGWVHAGARENTFVIGKRG